MSIEVRQIDVLENVAGKLAPNLEPIVRNTRIYELIQGRFEQDSDTKQYPVLAATLEVLNGNVLLTPDLVPVFYGALSHDATTKELFEAALHRANEHPDIFYSSLARYAGNDKFQHAVIRKTGIHMAETHRKFSGILPLKEEDMIKARGIINPGRFYPAYMYLLNSLQLAFVETTLEWQVLEHLEKSTPQN